MDGQVDDAAFLLTDLYNANNECEQLNVLTTLCNFLSNITYLHCKNIIFGRSLNVFLIPIMKHQVATQNSQRSV